MKLLEAIKNANSNSSNGNAPDAAKITKTIQTAIDQKSDQPNPFPIHALPKAIQNIVRYWHDLHRRPIDYHGGSVLAAASGAIGNAFQIKYTEGDVEPLSLWMVIVGPPSSAKSPIMKTCMRPLFKKERTYSKEQRERVGEWEKERVKNANKSKKTADIPRPVRQQRIVSDATIESLIKIFPNNWKGVLSFKDEFIGLMKGMNAYKTSGQDLEHFLSMWSGSPIMLNRSSLDDAVFIESPFIALLGSIQPKLLNRLADSEKIANGFLFRLLFCYPENVKIPKKTNVIPNPIFAQEYETILNRLNNLPSHPEQKATILELSSKAFQIYDSYKEDIEQNLMNQTDDENIQSLYGKMLAYTLRIAAILELLELVSTCDDGFFKCLSYKDIECHEISDTSIHRAIELTRYFIQNSLKILVEAENPVAALPRKQRIIYEHLPNNVTSALAVQIASKFGIGEKTARRLVYNRKLFTQNKDGTYRKCYT